MKSRAAAPHRTAHKRQRHAAPCLFDADPHPIESETPLLPELIAERVLAEAESHLATRLPDDWITQLAQRAEHCYRRNARFRHWLNRPGNESRDWLYAFMRHWLSSLIQKHNPNLHTRLPRGFCIGLADGRW